MMMSLHLKIKIKVMQINVVLKKSKGDQIPFIYTQPPFTGARKKHPIDRENGLFRPQINPNKS